MEPSDSSQPEDYSGFVDTQDKGRNYLFYIVIIVFVLILVGYIAVQSPQQEIELEAPLKQTDIEPAQPSEPSVSAQPVNEKRSVEQAEVTQSPSIAAESSSQMAMLTPANRAETPRSDTGSSAQSKSNPGEAARAMIDSMRHGDRELSLEQLFEQAVLHQQQEESTDAYLLYFFAARKGHGPSAFELAKMHDPAHFEAGSDMLDKPDLMQAHKWYSKAVEIGVDGAEQSLQDLRSAIEAAAEQGDLSAQRLLLNWK